MNIKQMIFLMLVFCLGMSSVKAANIHDLDIGDGLYLKGVFSEELVHVVRIDISGNRVKVRRSEDGTTKWVRPSSLISREESIGRNLGRAAGGVAIITCLLSPETCNNNNSKGSKSGNYKGYIFKVKNNCTRPVDLAIKYFSLNQNKWIVGSWWSIKESSPELILKFSDGSFPRSSNIKYFYYAKNDTEKLYWGGDAVVSVSGINYPMAEVTRKSTSSDAKIILSCPNI